MRSSDGSPVSGLKTPTTCLQEVGGVFPGEPERSCIGNIKNLLKRGGIMLEVRDR